MKKRPIAKSVPPAHDASLSFSKKTQLGASGAVVGAIIGGPIGAVVGGIVGTAFGAVAEISPAATNGNHSGKLVSPPSDKRAETASTGPKRRKSSIRVRAKTTQSKRTRPRRRR
jgi:hypothetical protein